MPGVRNPQLVLIVLTFLLVACGETEWSEPTPTATIVETNHTAQAYLDSALWAYEDVLRLMYVDERKVLYVREFVRPPKRLAGRPNSGPDVSEPLHVEARRVFEIRPQYRRFRGRGLKYEESKREYNKAVRTFGDALKELGKAGLTDQYKNSVNEYKNILGAATKRELDERHFARCVFRWVPVFNRKICLPRQGS